MKHTNIHTKKKIQLVPSIFVVSQFNGNLEKKWNAQEYSKERDSNTINARKRLANWTSFGDCNTWSDPPPILEVKHEALLQWNMKYCFNETWSPASMKHGVLLQWNMKYCFNETWSPASMKHGVLLQWNMKYCFNETWSPASMKHGVLL